MIAIVAAIALGQSLNLHDLANRSRRLLGTCVVPQLLQSNADNGLYASTLAQAANLVEPENDLKPPAIWQGPGQYNFQNADILLGAPGRKGWAQDHGMTVRGHVLVYPRDQGYTMPRWLMAEERTLTSGDAQKLLHDYIQAVVGRYKGKIAMWDVVNEAIDDRPNDRPFNLRDSFWLRKLGPEFITLAFRFAHEADPRAKLYYNDFGIEGGGWKADAVLALADHLKQQNAPIDGLGLQYHIWLGNKVAPGDGHYKLLQEIKDRRLSFMITEVDVAIKCADFPRGDPKRGVVAADPADLQEQANVYRGVLQMAYSFKNCRGVQLWGFTDRHSWIPQFEPGMGAALDFDYDYQPKPAALAIADLLRH